MQYSEALTYMNYLKAVAQVYQQWFAIVHPGKPVPKEEELVNNLVVQDHRESHRAIAGMLVLRIELSDEDAIKTNIKPALEFTVEQTVVHDEDYANAYWFKILAKDVDGVIHDYQIMLTFDDIVGYVYLQHEDVNPLFIEISPMAHFSHRLAQIGR